LAIEARGFRPTYEAYVDEMFRVGRHLMGLIALSLDLPEDYFAEGLAEPLFNSRLLRYARNRRMLPSIRSEPALTPIGA
jgi:isopenicillin N synthase-like dioxygenase